MPDDEMPAPTWPLPHPLSQNTNATALSTATLRWTYAELSEAVAARAEDLTRQGLRPSQVVIGPATPATDLILMQHAVIRIGAALLPIRADLDTTQCTTLADATGAAWRWQPSPTGGTLNPTPHPTASRPTVGAIYNRDQPTPSPPASHPDPLALLVQTSGTSGTPKIAMLTAGSLAASAAAINDRIGLDTGDAWLNVLPRQHIGGLAISYRCALAGAALVICERFDTEAVRAELGTADDPPITHLSLVPPMLARLLEAGTRPKPTLRAVLLGGQALDPALARRAVAAGWPLYLGYGMTETGSMIAGGRVREDGSAVLVPLPGIELDCPACGAEAVQGRSSRAADTDDQAQAVRPLRLRGPMVMAGYAHPEHHRGIGLTEDGWLTTADLGCRSGDGSLRILGRADAMLVIGGVNVLPARVEQRLAAAPGIGDIAIIGIPEPVWGHRLVAVYTGAIEPADLDAWCRRTLSGAERPRGFRRIAALPLLPSGKVDRRALLKAADASARHRPPTRI